MSSNRIAAIDIGTNSIHMIIAELAKREYRVVDKEKEMVQLGLSSLDGAPLSEEAMQRGVAAISKMCEVARGWQVDDIIAVATSAVREAPNRREFLRRVKDAAGIKPRVISGEEEAHYIYYAVRAAVDFGSATALCIDIGGGSVEFIVGTSDEIYYTASEPLGSLRLAQKFHLQDRPVISDVEACRQHVSEHLRKVQKRVRGLGVDMAVGTSGTILTLTNMVAAGSGASPASTPRALTHDALVDLVGLLSTTSAAERMNKYGIEEKRAATIVGGAIVLETILDELQIDSILGCQAAIREGIVQTHLSEDGETARAGATLRRESAVALADRSGSDKRHARHVARLALRIFDQTAKIHALPPDNRELLEYAALLHETGMHVSDRGYHKHSYYLVRHANLRGFTEEQLIIVANVARYHRKATPADDHQNLEELTPQQRGDVEKLAAILRIAEALDRSHGQAVRDVAVDIRGDQMRFVLRERADASVEMSAAKKRARYFSQLFERTVKFETR
jgi:exopolyphosphatase / guanosine-5'-triphosphate,3'-diphosphate pyrophosphatase